MKQRSTAIVLAITALIMLGILGCSVGRRIVKGPSPATATPTSTRRPTYTPTASPTFTQVAMAKPTNTATRVVPPANTPAPGATSPQTAPQAPTNTPVAPKPKATAKPKPPAPPPTPTPPPAPPPPTNTPAPTTPYAGKIVTGFPNCGSTGVFGFVRDRSNQKIADIRIRVWGDTWKGEWAKSSGDSFGNDGDRNYEFKIADAIAPGVWHVAITDGKSETMLSPSVDVTSSQKCEGDGAVQWTKVDFTKY